MPPLLMPLGTPARAHACDWRNMLGHGCGLTDAQVVRLADQFYGIASLVLDVGNAYQSYALAAPPVGTSLPGPGGPYVSYVRH